MTQRTGPALLVAAVLIVGALLAPAASAPARAQATDPAAGGKNLVILQNRVDGRLTTRGEVQLNRIPGLAAGPANVASAESSCIDCQSLAVALQINLISRTATSITPQNAATAVNSGCTGCYTVARALQYVIQVDDPAQVPPEVTQLIRSMNHELTAMQTDPSLTLDQAEARVDAVLAQFAGLARDLNDQRDAQVDGAGPTSATTPTATPSPGAVGLPTATPATTPMPEMTSTPSPTAPPETPGSMGTITTPTATPTAGSATLTPGATG